MKSAYQIIRAHADLLDSQHKPDQPITVRGTRAYLRQWFKPEKRGGVLLVNRHPLQIIPASKAVPLDQVELL